MGMSLMLLPMAVLVVVAYFGLQSTVGALQQVVKDPLAEMLFTRDLQNQVQAVAFPVHHYVTHDSPRARDRYSQLSVEIDLGFAEAARFQYLDEEERKLLLEAETDWKKAREQVRELFGQLRFYDHHDKIFAEGMDTFSSHLNAAVDHLDELAALSLEEVQTQQTYASSTKLRSVIAIGLIFIIGFLVAVVSAIRLARSIIAPIRQLEERIVEFETAEIEGAPSPELARRTDELQHLQSAFSHLAGKLERVKRDFEYLSSHDSLTGLYDRKKFQEVLAQEMHRASRYKRPFSLLLIDIDAFKEINDTYGELIGDSVLCTVASYIAGTIRPTDTAARYVGGEIAVILSETAREGAVETAERIRKQIVENPLNIGDGVRLSVTVSVGVSVFPHDADSDSQVFVSADRALLAAKVLGRNRVCTVADVVAAERLSYPRR